MYQTGFIRPRRRGAQPVLVSEVKPGAVDKVAVRLSPYWDPIVVLRILPDILVGLIDQYAALTREEAIRSAVLGRVSTAEISGKRHVIFSTSTYELMFTNATHRSVAGRRAPRPTFTITSLCLSVGVSSTLSMGPEKFAQAIIQKNWLMQDLSRARKRSTQGRTGVLPITIALEDLARIYEWLGFDQRVEPVSSLPG